MAKEEEVVSTYSIIYHGNGRWVMQENLIWFEIKFDTCLKKSCLKQWLKAWLNYSIKYGGWGDESGCMDLRLILVN